MAGIKGRSGHVGKIGIDPQSPMKIYKGPYRGEKSQGKGPDLYFQTQVEMIVALADRASFYTPMAWNEDRKQYEIDFSSAELLGY